MAQRGSTAWLIALAFAYCWSCFVLILIYETYFRDLVVGTFREGDVVGFDVNNNGSTKRRTAAVLPPKEWAQAAITDRLHVCKLKDATIKLPQAPDLILAGAMKSGTTYFWHLLREHPDFIPSKKFEAHFFDWKFAVPPGQIKRPSFWLRFNATTEEDYLCAARKEYIEDTFKVSSLMKRSETRLSYEKTPNYMFLPQIPELIHKICPWKPKIILILRNPVDRAYSHYIMDASKDKARLSFEEYIQLELKTLRDQRLSNVPEIPTSEWAALDETKSHLFDIPKTQRSQEHEDQAHWMVYRNRHMQNYLHRGMYSVQLLRWIKYFPLNESLMVINNEHLLREPRRVMGEVLEFVGANRKDYFADERVPITFDVEKNEKKTKYAEVKKHNGKLVRSMSYLLSVGGYHPMSNGTRHFLEMFFKPYNAQLHQILGDEWKDVWNYDQGTGDVAEK